MTHDPSTDSPETPIPPLACNPHNPENPYNSHTNNPFQQLLHSTIHPLRNERINRNKEHGMITTFYISSKERKRKGGEGERGEGGEGEGGQGNRDEDENSIERQKQREKEKEREVMLGLIVDRNIIEANSQKIEEARLRVLALKARRKQISDITLELLESIKEYEHIMGIYHQEKVKNEQKIAEIDELVQKTKEKETQLLNLQASIANIQQKYADTERNIKEDEERLTNTTYAYESYTRKSKILQEKLQKISKEYSDVKKFEKYAREIFEVFVIQEQIKNARKLNKINRKLLELPFQPQMRCIEAQESEIELCGYHHIGKKTSNYDGHRYNSGSSNFNSTQQHMEIDPKTRTDNTNLKTDKTLLDLCQIYFNLKLRAIHPRVLNKESYFGGGVESIFGWEGFVGMVKGYFWDRDVEGDSYGGQERDRETGAGIEIGIERERKEDREIENEVIEEWHNFRNHEKIQEQETFYSPQIHQQKNHHHISAILLVSETCQCALPYQKEENLAKFCRLLEKYVGIEVDSIVSGYECTKIRLIDGRSDGGVDAGIELGVVGAEGCESTPKNVKKYFGIWSRTQGKAASNKEKSTLTTPNSNFSYTQGTSPTLS